WWPGLQPLDAGDGPLAGELVTEQLKSGRSAGHHITLDQGPGVAALIHLAVRIEEQHTHSRILRRLGDDRVRTQVSIGVVGHHPGEYFAKVDATESTVQAADVGEDRKSTRLNSSHVKSSYAV